MYQTNRNNAVSELVDQLLAGVAKLSNFHAGARVYFAAAVASAKSGSCIVCGSTLIGTQEHLCSGHWDYVLIPQEALVSTELLVDYLETNLSLSHIEKTSQPWPLVTKGHSRCEICDTPTDNVEELRSGREHTLKRHVVCSDHQAFRWVE